jgi:hypothetical protein
MLAGIPEVKNTLEMKVKAADSKIKNIEVKYIINYHVHILLNMIRG